MDLNLNTNKDTQNGTFYVNNLIQSRFIQLKIKIKFKHFLSKAVNTKVLWKPNETAAPVWRRLRRKDGRYILNVKVRIIALRGRGIAKH